MMSEIPRHITHKQRYEEEFKEKILDELLAPPAGGGVVLPAPTHRETLARKDRDALRQKCNMGHCYPFANWTLSAMCWALDSLGWEDNECRAVDSILNLWKTIKCLRWELLLWENEIIALRKMREFVMKCGKVFPSSIHAVLFLSEKLLAEIWDVAFAANPPDGSPQKDTDLPFEGSGYPLPPFVVDWWYKSLPALRAFYRKPPDHWACLLEMENEAQATTLVTGIEQELAEYLLSKEHRLEKESAGEQSCSPESKNAVSTTAASGQTDGTTAPQYVTLLQMAYLIKISKSTLERWKSRPTNPFPLPDIDGGGGGRADKWIWTRVRIWLQQETRMQLPERFPDIYPEK
jgi:hypothetical protein